MQPNPADDARAHRCGQKPWCSPPAALAEDKELAMDALRAAHVEDVARARDESRDVIERERAEHFAELDRERAARAMVEAALRDEIAALHATPPDAPHHDAGGHGASMRFSDAGYKRERKKKKKKKKT
jgi:hypothetical protein